jgi:hypothetical protein
MVVDHKSYKDGPNLSRKRSVKAQHHRLITAGCEEPLEQQRRSLEDSMGTLLTLTCPVQKTQQSCLALAKRKDEQVATFHFKLPVACTERRMGSGLPVGAHVAQAQVLLAGSFA